MEFRSKIGLFEVPCVRRAKIYAKYCSAQGSDVWRCWI